MPQICVSKLTTIGSGNGLSPAGRAKPLSEIIVKSVYTNLGNKLQCNLKRNSYIFLRKCIWKCHLWNDGNFVSASMCWCSITEFGHHWFRTLQSCHNGHDSVSNHQPHDCLLSRLFRCRSKKTSKLRVTGLCAGNSPETGEFPAQMASNAENVSIWWRHHEITRHLIGAEPSYYLLSYRQLWKRILRN